MPPPNRPILAWLGALLVGVGVVAVLGGSTAWWPAVVSGGLLILWAANGHSPHSLYGWLRAAPRRLAALYAVFAVIGLGQEIVGRLTGIWVYQGAWATALGTAGLILLGYPLFLAVVYESQVALRTALGCPGTATAVNVVVLTAWNEIPARLAPLYIVAEPFDRYRLIIFAVGYAIQVALAVAAGRLWVPATP